MRGDERTPAAQLEPLAVLPYQPPEEQLTDVRRMHWWILCGGLIFGCAATGAMLCSLMMRYISLVQFEGAVLACVRVCISSTMLLCYVLVAMASLSALRERFEARIAVRIILIASVGLAALSMTGALLTVFTRPRVALYGGSLGPDLASLIRVPLPVLWPFTMCWALRSADLEMSEASVMRRLCVAGAILGAIGCADLLSYPLMNLVFDPLRFWTIGASSWARLVCSILIMVMFIVASRHPRRGARLIRIGAGAFVVLAALELFPLNYWLMGRPSSSPSSLINFSIASRFLHYCIIGVIVTIPFVLTFQRRTARAHHFG